MVQQFNKYIKGKGVHYAEFVSQLAGRESLKEERDNQQECEPLLCPARHLLLHYIFTPSFRHSLIPSFSCTFTQFVTRKLTRLPARSLGHRAGLPVSLEARTIAIQYI